MKLTESLSLHQQQAILDEIVISAVKQGIIKDDTLISRPEMVHHLAVCLGETSNPRKKIVEFLSGVIMPTGKCALLTLNEKDEKDAWKEVKTSVPQTPFTPGKARLTWFETINTLYIMAVAGEPIDDLRRIKNQEEESE
ncbi:hypothetical protein DEEACLCL_00077 [Salmonella phage CRW-SP2]|nr:hypothetical protein DEEACLCL_00077 [Salmonella phage CRW-SP2]